MLTTQISINNKVFCYSLWGSLESSFIWDLVSDSISIIRLKSAQPVISTRQILSFLRNVHPEDMLPVEDVIMGYLLEKSEFIDVVFRFRINLSWRWIRLRGKLGDKIDGDFQEKIIGTLKDVTESQLYLAKISRTYHFDPLTGLYNRKHFVSELNRYTQQHSAFFLVLIELYQLYRAKNSLSYHDIDQKTLDFSERLKQLSPEKSLIGQFSSDCFIIAMPMTSHDFHFINELQQMYSHDPLMHFSCGISEYSDEQNDIESLISHAHTANHINRNQTDAYAIYSKQQDDQFTKNSHMIRLLRKALKEHEITFYLQPKYAADKMIKGAELLCRWHSDDYGFVSPAVFIPLIEQYNLTRDLYLNALHFACNVQDSLLKEGIDIILAINITTSDIISPVFMNDLHQIFNNRTHLHKIEFEVTESIFIQDMDAANKALAELSQMGFRIAMDDFGTGYSSLAYISKFHFDTIKIDQSFIADMITNDKSRVLISGIVGLCHALNINIVAEGVETETQMTYLQELGVQRYQGFLLSKPLPLSDFYQTIRGSYLP